MEIELDSTPADFTNYQNDMRELSDEGYFDGPETDFDDDSVDDQIPGEDYEHHDIDSFYEDRFDMGDE